MASLLDQELKTYEAEKLRLLGESQGSFVLIKGTDVKGVFSSEDDAISAGYREFGNTPFLVKAILEDEITEVISSCDVNAPCQV